MTEDELVYNETVACNELVSQINQDICLVVQEINGVWFVSFQGLGDAVTGRAVNLFNTVSSPNRLGAWQAMRAQLEVMLAE